MMHLELIIMSITMTVMVLAVVTILRGVKEVKADIIILLDILILLLNSMFTLSTPQPLSRKLLMGDTEEEVMVVILVMVVTEEEVMVAILAMVVTEEEEATVVMEEEVTVVTEEEAMVATE